MRSERWVDGLFLALAVLDLGIAGLVTLGVAFSSYRLSMELAVFLDLPIAIGILTYFTRGLSFVVFTSIGCAATLVYLIRFAYASVKNGIQPCHSIWVGLS